MPMMTEAERTARVLRSKYRFLTRVMILKLVVMPIPAFVLIMAELSPGWEAGIVFPTIGAVVAFTTPLVLGLYRGDDANGAAQWVYRDHDLAKGFCITAVALGIVPVLFWILLEAPGR